MPAAHAEIVFIVDDDFDMRSSLQVLVSAMGYQVRTFASAAEFRNQYRPDLPGCLILEGRKAPWRNVGIPEREDRT